MLALAHISMKLPIALLRALSTILHVTSTSRHVALCHCCLRVERSTRNTSAACARPCLAWRGASARGYASRSCQRWSSLGACTYCHRVRVLGTYSRTCMSLLCYIFSGFYWRVLRRTEHTDTRRRRRPFVPPLFALLRPCWYHLQQVLAFVQKVQELPYCSARSLRFSTLGVCPTTRGRF